MQAYAEGFEIMEHSEFDLDLHEIAGIWRYGSVVRSLAARAAARGVRAARLEARRHRAVRRGLGRGPLDDQRGDQRERAGAGDRGVALRALRVAATRSSSRRRSRAALRNQFGGHAVRAVEAREGRSGPALSVAIAQENPLLEGLQLRRAPDPCASRHLRRVGRPDAAQALPGALLARAAPAAARAVRGRRRRAHRGDDDEFRDRMKEAVQEHARDEFRDDVWDDARGGHALRRDGLRRRRWRGQRRRGARRARRGARDAAATASTTSPTPPSAFRDDRRAQSASGAAPRAGRG